MSNSNQIKNYQIKENLGRGTYGDIFKAIDINKPHLKIVLKRIAINRR